MKTTGNVKVQVGQLEKESSVCGDNGGEANAPGVGMTWIRKIEGEK